ncbi:ATP-binding protein [Mesonia sp. MT50]|uniref:ATP-binding protein n=1 Tax=Mesonia profundi TaxID=3070998 RepID=A0ABU1A3I3_9FLAO|nr:ATP-binding protein [Mesonia profundi]MDQ7918263.1 ATP-binding protein [Mesonia profundi]
MFIKIKNNLCVYLGVALCLFLGIFFVFFKKQASPKEHLHRVEKQLRLAQNNNNSLAKRREALDRAAVYAHFLAPSAIKQEKLNGIAYQAYYLKDSIQFRRLNHSALAEAKLTADTMAIADAHWNFGAFYLSHENYAQAFYHYAEARRGFSQKRHAYYEAKMWYNMAFIKGRLKDYEASEAYVYKALPYFLKAKKIKQIYRCYTQLAIIYEDLEGFKQAHHYYQLALESLPKNTNSLLQEAGYNNIGLLWHRQEAYEKAIVYYNKALTNKNIKNKQPALYARLIDNRAYSQFLAQKEKAYEKEFWHSLQLRERLGNTAGVIISKLHISEWYASKGDTLSAICYAQEAYDEAERIELRRESLAALEWLVNIDPSHGAHYLNLWHVLQSKHQRRLRQQRNNVAKVQFKTQQYQERSLQLTRQKRILLFILLGVGVIGLLVYILLRQRSKYKKLKRIQQKEQELQQEREDERYRIAEDLHDGILSKLFGVRLSWGLLTLGGTSEAQEEHRLYLKALKEIEKEIREVSHHLKKDPPGYSFYQEVENLLRKKARLGNFTYQLKEPKFLKEGDIPQKVKKHLYAIMEEMLQNILKHAQATHVNYQLSVRKNELYLEVCDNGKGFNLESKQEGIGIQNIKSRIQQMDGKLQLKSKLRKGTCYVIRLDMKSWKSKNPSN